MLWYYKVWFNIFIVTSYCFSDQQVDSWRRADGPKIMWSNRRCCWRLSKNLTSTLYQFTCIEVVLIKSINYHISNIEIQLLIILVKVINRRQFKVKPCYPHVLHPAKELLKKLTLCYSCFFYILHINYGKKTFITRVILLNKYLRNDFCFESVGVS